MSVSSSRVSIVAIACLIALTGCETSTKLGSLISSNNDPMTTSAAPTDSVAPEGDPATTGSVAGLPDGPTTRNPNLLGSDPEDDLNIGKKQYRAGNFGLAEKHFRRAVEMHPRDAEAWVGLAASYDRLKRFDLADRAYDQATGIMGPTPEILNNRGYSYLLRGDYGRARATLLAARAQDPQNPYIQNNIDLLEKSASRGKGVRK
jgi:tetratricopeptide (TPR) repeat protein